MNTLYLMRHGVALDVGERGVASDADRPLSDVGRRKTLEVARGLKTLGVKPGLIVTSPLTRARQTARVVAETLGRKVRVEESELLCPAASGSETVAWLRTLAVDDVMVVGHMPHLVHVASILLCGELGMSIDMRKAGVCCISLNVEDESSMGRLEWHLNPRPLRIIASGHRK